MAENAKPPKDEGKPTVYFPPKPNHYDGTPYWLARSPDWPAKMEWTLGPDGEYTHDSAQLRLNGVAIQSFLSGPKSDEHPIICWFEITAYPVPVRLAGHAWKIDSVIFRDPLRDRFLPKLAMLANERHTEDGRVRTRFTNNLAVLHSPELTEDQLLEPILYLTPVEKKTIVIKMPPIKVTFLRELKPTDPVPDSAFNWGPG